jgi:hypothetical protein
MKNFKTDRAGMENFRVCRCFCAIRGSSREIDQNRFHPLPEVKYSRKIPDDITKLMPFDCAKESMPLRKDILVNRTFPMLQRSSALNETTGIKGTVQKLNEKTIEDPM